MCPRCAGARVPFPAGRFVAWWSFSAESFWKSLPQWVTVAFTVPRNHRQGLPSSGSQLGCENAVKWGWMEPPKPARPGGPCLAVCLGPRWLRAVGAAAVQLGEASPEGTWPVFKGRAKSSDLFRDKRAKKPWK